MGHVGQYDILALPGSAPSHTPLLFGIGMLHSQYRYNKSFLCVRSKHSNDIWWNYFDVFVRHHSYEFYCFIVHHVLHFLLCLSVCVYVSRLCLWAMLPDLNKMMMIITALHHLICRRSSLVSLMWPHVAGWDRRLPTNSLCRHTACLYSRSEGLPDRQSLHLERSACGCDLRSITAGVQTTPGDSSVPPQLFEHMCYLNFVFPSLIVVLAVFFILRPL